MAEKSNTESDGSGPDEETKRKFQEALARKQGEAHGAAGHRAAGSVAVPAGNTKHQRMFRRKSGG